VSDAHWRALSAIAYDGSRKARAMATFHFAVGSDPRRLIDRDLRSLATYAGAWVAAVLISATVNAVLVNATAAAWAQYLALYGGYWSLWALAVPLIYRMVARPRGSAAPARAARVGMHGLLLAALMLASNLYFLAWNALVAGVATFDLATYASRFTGRGAPLFVGVHLFKYVAACLICSSVWHRRRARREEEARVAAELESRSLAVQLADARLASLREQLHPHFLFNALNCIASLIEIRRNSDAYAAVSDLATLLRQTLEMGRRQAVSLREDVEHARSYLRIAELRFGSHLSWRIETDGDCESLAVPPLLLQPLVENAVKHAANQSETPVCIRVAAHAAQGGAEILVSDDGPGLGATSAGAAGTGIGLGNLRERLELLYGAAARLSVGAGEGGRGTVVRIFVPRRSARVESGVEAGS
jgi:signal transduction histidine kinase